jgi:uncharacterized repeat protein (TIGR04076 family)
MPKIKITVVKKINNKDMFGDNSPVEFTTNPVCDRVEVGQELVSDGFAIPEGFCPWAFADIQRDIIHLRLGGNYPWIKKEGMMLSSCTDGVRPVIFKLERIED